MTSITFLDCCDFVSISRTSGTDEAAVIEVLSSRTSEQRQQIKQKYKEKYSKVCRVVPTSASASVTHLRREGGRERDSVLETLNFWVVRISLLPDLILSSDFSPCFIGVWVLP